MNQLSSTEFNRLSVARFLFNDHLTFRLPNGYYVHVFHQKEDHEAGNGEVWPKGIYSCSTIYAENFENLPHTQSGWIRIGWKYLLELIRDQYQTRVVGQCKFRYTTEIRCTSCRDEHRHCKCCEEVTFNGKLCHDCEKKAKEARGKLVALHATYYATYGILPTFTEEENDYISGECYGFTTSRRRDGEDFHADV